MLAGYVDTAIRIRQMAELEFFSTFGESMRVLRYVEGGCKSAAARVWDLHHRHAQEVCGVIARGIAKYGDQLLLRELPADCLIRLSLDQGTVVIREPAAIDEPANFVRKSGKAWLIRFNRQAAKHYPDNIGFAYLEFLFQHIGRSFTAIELDYRVRQRRFCDPIKMASADQFEFSEVSATLGTPGDSVLDSDAIRQCIDRLAVLEERIDQHEAARDLSSLEEIEILELERAQILAQLEESKGLLGKTVEFKSERSRARHRVGNAIRRALRWFEEYDRALHEHLQLPTLKLGHTICYAPAEDPNWVSVSEEIAVPA